MYTDSKLQRLSEIIASILCFWRLDQWWNRYVVLATLTSHHLSLITPCFAGLNCSSYLQSIAAEEQQQKEVSFAAQPGEGGAGAGASGGTETRNVDGPKVSLEELMSYVRNSKVNLLKEALDYLPTKKFDKSLVQVGSLLTMSIESQVLHLY